ncbi:MAG: tetratricopeptide repeat protein, partial [Gemmatimonadetes bacterium]|nr:tetratricopeptide repeat protein [Gemmatimonadota bacterium]
MSESTGFRHFLAELKRRKVFRVTAVYGAASFGILQAADILFPRVGLPDWTVTLVAALALAGFPLALILSWAYERTPDGVQKTDPAVTGELEAIASEPARNRWPLGLAALGGIVLLAFSAWWVLGRPDSADARTYDSIAVLPFIDMTGNPENEYLGDGLAEELLNALAGVEGLKVASRTSTFAFKGSNVGATEIGDSLDVATVLEGSVRTSPDRLRVTAQLIDADTGFHLWSETYDRAPADLLDIQDDLTQQIMDALAVQLAPSATGGERPVVQRGTENPEAYDYFLQGRFFWNKRTGEDLDVAVGLFEKAIEADSNFAAAYAGIADARVVPAGWGDDPGTALDTAEAYARRALEIDPALAQAHTALAYTQLMDLDLQAAEASFRRAIELDPGYPTGHQWYAEVLVATDRDAEAIEQLRLAESLDPTMIIRWHLGRALYQAGHYEEAIAQLRPLAVAEGGYRGPAIDYIAQSYELLRDYDAMISTYETHVFDA